MNDRFEWDSAKAGANWRDHGVAFEQAIEAFRDPFAVETIDDREDYGEERINLLGMSASDFACDIYRAQRAHPNNLGPAGGTT
jgi:uncharacterized DUF497 family protein